MMKKITRKTWIFAALGLLVVATAVPLTIIGVTPEGSAPREWVVNFRQTMLALWGLAALIGVIAMTFHRWSGISSAVVRFLLKAAIWIVTLVLLYALLFVLVFGMSWLVEEEDYGDTLLVEETVWLDRSTRAIYEKQGPFYMHRIQEVPKLNVPTNVEEPMQSPAKPPVLEEEPAEKQERQRISKGAQAVCESLGADYVEHFDAKGYLRVTVEETERAVSYLRFDRYSANGSCLLYVLSEEEKEAPGQETIRNMYAYVLETGEVIASGKTDWGAPGSEAYQNATGEP